MIKFLKYVVLGLVVSMLLPAGLVFSQEETNLYFNNVMEDLGVPTARTECLLQDGFGFMWFGYEGFSRFDGQELTSYPLTIPAEKGVLNSFATAATLDSYGNIWIGTSNGLFKYEVKSDKISPFLRINPDSISSNYITDVCFVDAQNLLIGTLSEGLILLNTDTKTTQTFLHEETHVNSISSNKIKRIFKTSHGDIWVGTDRGLDFFNPSVKQAIHVLENKDIRDMAEDEKGRIWVAPFNDNAIYVVEAGSGAVSNKVMLPPVLNQKLKTIEFDHQNQLWLCVLDRGVYRIDPENPGELSMVNNKNEGAGQPIKFPLNLFVDKAGDVWIATLFNGIYHYHISRKPFRFIQNTNHSQAYNLKGTRSIHQDKDGSIWVGARNAGVLSLYSPNEDAFQDFFLPTQTGELEEDLILTIKDGPGQQLLIGTVHNGIFLFDKGSKQFTPLLKKRLKSNTIYGLLYKNGKIWIGYDNQGLDVYDMASGDIRTYRQTHLVNSLSVGYIKDMVSDRFGEVWVLTLKGLNKYNAATDGFERYLTDHQVNCLYVDMEGNRYAGTNSGLYAMRKDETRFEYVPLPGVWGSTNVVNIIEDNARELWLNIEKGIVKYSPETHESWSYAKAEGLQNSFFFPAACLLKNGDLMFGGSNGIITFDPSLMVEEQQNITVRIVDVKVNNKSVSVKDGGLLSKSILITDTLVLGYKDRIFSLEFAALEFGGRANINYEYRLNGFEKNWNNVSKQRTATYTNIPSGKYVFEVKATHNKGTSTDTPRRLFIKVLPPIWRTWYAYLTYVLVLMGAFVRYRKFVIQRMEERRNKELDKEKLKLFVNISHEFRTPLTLMLNPLQQLVENLQNPQNKKHALLAFKSTQKLLNLVNQLQAFRKVDLGMTALAITRLNGVEFVAGIVDNFKDIAAHKSLELTLEQDLKDPFVFVDADKLEKIINNLLSNSIKYTDKGHVVVRLSSEFLRSGARDTHLHLRIDVTDTGIGLTKEQMKCIFDRFYQVDSNKVGTGIGLNFVKSLVETHKGSIAVNSQLEVGTTFTVFLPCEKTSYKTEGLGGHTKVDEDKTQTAQAALAYDIATLEELNQRHFEDRTRLTMLVVEDNKALASQLKESFSPHYKVVLAENGLEGFQKAQKSIPDIIISDVMMPEMDGVELCKQVKSNEDLCHVPFIMLTAKALVEDQIEGYEVGADAYIAKPFYMHLLHARVKNMLENRSLLKERFMQKTIFANPDSEEQLPSKDERFLEEVTRFVLNHLDNSSLASKDIYTAMAMSKTHFYNRISSLSGYSPSVFIRNIRIKCSAELLVKGDKEIKEICYSVGFNSPPYFAKCFKEVYGMSPSDFQNKHSHS